MWEAGVDEESVKQINEYANTIEEEVALTGDVSAGSKLTDYRRSKIRWLPASSAGTAPIINMVSSMFTEANNNAFGVDWTSITQLQHTLYEADEQGHYDFHHDVFYEAPVMTHRKLSMSIQLSDGDEYEGGDFEFSPHYMPHPPDPKALRKKGTVLIFPSFILHKVTPVTKGERKALVVWAEGPLWR